MNRVNIAVLSILLWVNVAEFCDSEPCEPGFYCLQPNFTCQECPNGTFQPEIGRSPSCRNHTVDPTDKQQSYHLVQAGSNTVDNIWEPINNRSIDPDTPTADSQKGKQLHSSNLEVVIIVLATLLGLLLLVIGIVMGLLLWIRTRTCTTNQQQNETRELERFNVSH